MTRTQKEVVTPNGHKFLIHDYITGGEMRQIQALYMENLSADDFKGDTKSAMSKVPVSTVFKAQEMALKFILVNVDDENAYEKAMELREEDLNYLIAIVDEYTSGSMGDPKKNKELSPSISQAD